ncbi:hypothetical protein E2K70_12190, partial [Escherichia coli]
MSPEINGHTARGSLRPDVHKLHISDRRETGVIMNFHHLAYWQDKAARLGRQALLFPLCLVLYEFSTYIGNDMIQPGMLAVVEQYQAG